MNVRRRWGRLGGFRAGLFLAIALAALVLLGAPPGAAAAKAKNQYAVPGTKPVTRVTQLRPIAFDGADRVAALERQGRREEALAVLRRAVNRHRGSLGILHSDAGATPPLHDGLAHAR